MMNRKNLKLEIDYIFDLDDKDSVFIEAQYRDGKRGEEYHYQMGLSGSKGAVAGEMIFHSSEQLEKMSKYADEAIKDFESTTEAIKQLKGIK